MGNVHEANAILNDLLGYVLFSEGNSIEIVKSRAIELCSLLSRAAIESGAPTDNILKLNNHFLKNLQQITTMDTLCFKLQEIVEAFSESMFNYIPSKNSELVKKSMLYISEHFNEPINLERCCLPRSSPSVLFFYHVQAVHRLFFQRVSEDGAYSSGSKRLAFQYGFCNH